jgi:hypothetical protein
LIIAMLAAGVATVFAKSEKTTPTAKRAPHSVTSVLPAPSGTSNQPAPTNSLKKNPPDELANVPATPVTGVPSYPIGFILLGGAAFFGFVFRRLVRE